MSIPQRPGVTGWQGRVRRRAGGACGRTGGTVGPCPIAGGAVFRCRTLEWVVRGIPKKNRHDTHQWTRLSCDAADEIGRLRAPTSFSGRMLRRRQFVPNAHSAITLTHSGDIFFVRNQQ